MNRECIASYRLAVLCVVLLSVAAAQDQSSKNPVFLNIDHASICGSNLDSMRQSFASAGLATDFGGPHATGGTQMALLGFDDGSYLELIAPQDASAAQESNWAKFISGDAGPCAWAVEPKDIDAEIARLKAIGTVVRGPESGTRKRPDGMNIEWQTANIGSGTPGSLLPFLIQDRTPRQWRVAPSASVQGSALTGVEIVVLAVNDLNSSIALFRKTYNWAEPITEDHGEFGAKLAYFPGQPVVLAAPSGNKSWITDRLQKFGESPAAYLLATNDYNAANKKFKLSGAKPWFSQRVGWFDPNKLKGIRLGVIGQ
jgi:hypothetical protein